MGFNLINWTSMSGSYFLYGSILEKCGIFLKNGRFYGRIWPDWGNTTWADMAGLGSIGLMYAYFRPYFRRDSIKFYTGRVVEYIRPHVLRQKYKNKQ